MGKQLPGKSGATVAGSAAPTGVAGLDMAATFFDENSRPRRWIVTVVVTVAPGNLTIWGSLPNGVEGDHSDDIWGTVQDEYGTYPGGLMATALPIGTHHFIMDTIGVFSQLYFQNSAGTMNVTVTEIIGADRSN